MVLLCCVSFNYIIHNPVRVKVINSYDFIIHDLAYHNGVVFLATERGLYYHDLKQSVPVKPSKLRTHAAIDSVYLDLNVENNGVTIRDKQEFLTEHIKTVKIQRGSIPKGAHRSNDFNSGCGLVHYVRLYEEDSVQMLCEKRWCWTNYRRDFGCMYLVQSCIKYGHCG